MSGKRKYPDELVARIKALYVMGFGHKRIANLIGLPAASVRNLAVRPDPPPDIGFIERFRAFVKGDT